jgi:hypothetical protein
MIVEPGSGTLGKVGMLRIVQGADWSPHVVASGLEPETGELDRVEALAKASVNQPLAQELVQMVATVRGLVAAMRLLASEMEGDD